MIQSSENLDLSPEAIDRAAALAEDFFTGIGMDRRDVLRYRLSLEELLLDWFDKQISDSFQLVIGKRARKLFLYVECAGIPMNPFAEQEESDGAFLHDLQKNLGVYPQYSYRNGKNRSVYYVSGKAITPLKKILICFAGAALLGLLLQSLLPADYTALLLTSLIDPLYSAAFRILNCVAGPLILLSVMWGIYGIGDAATLGLLGKDLILRFLLISLVLSALCTLCFPLFGLTLSQTVEEGSAFQSIFEMILDIIPSDILSPLVSNNTLQIIFIAVIIGISMLFLGKEVSTFADVIEQVNAIVRFLMEFISKLIPFIVFLIVLRMILSGSLSLFRSTWIFAIAYIGGCLVFSILHTLITALVQHTSPLLLLKKSLPTILVTLTTASSAAAFGSNMETCEKRFGIDNSLSSFGIPLGMVIFKTGSVVFFVFSAFYFSNLCDVPCSASWLFSAGFISFMMSFSSPPIPGGGAVAYALLFSRLGIPDEALAMLLSIDMIFDFIITTVNIYNLPLALINSAAVQGLLDRNILHKKTTKTQ